MTNNPKINSQQQHPLHQQPPPNTVLHHHHHQQLQQQFQQPQPLPLHHHHHQHIPDQNFPPQQQPPSSQPPLHQQQPIHAGTYTQYQFPAPAAASGQPSNTTTAQFSQPVPSGTLSPSYHIHYNPDNGEGSSSSTTSRNGNYGNNPNGRDSGDDEESSKAATPSRKGGEGIYIDEETARVLGPLLSSLQKRKGPVPLASLEPASSPDGDVANSSRLKRKPEAERHHLTQACDRCRQKKRKCDGALPYCSACAKTEADPASTCTHNMPHKKRGPKKGYRSHLNERMDALETMVRTTGPTPSSAAAYPVFVAGPPGLPGTAGLMDEGTRAGAFFQSAARMGVTPSAMFPGATPEKSALMDFDLDEAMFQFQSTIDTTFFPLVNDSCSLYDNPYSSGSSSGGTPSMSLSGSLANGSLPGNLKESIPVGSFGPWFKKSSRPHSVFLPQRPPGVGTPTQSPTMAGDSDLPPINADSLIYSKGQVPMSTNWRRKFGLDFPSLGLTLQSVFPTTPDIGTLTNPSPQFNGSPGSSTSSLLAVAQSISTPRPLTDLQTYLVRLYFSKLHALHPPIFHESTFFAELLPVNKHPPYLIEAICAFSAMFTTNPEILSMANRIEEAKMSEGRVIHSGGSPGTAVTEMLVDGIMEKLQLFQMPGVDLDSLASIQTWLILASVLFGIGKPSLCMQALQSAIRMCMRMKIDREAPNFPLNPLSIFSGPPLQFTASQLEARRRAWVHAMLLDTYAGTVSGLPLIMDETIYPLMLVERSQTEARKFTEWIVATGCGLGAGTSSARPSEGGSSSQTNIKEQLRKEKEIMGEMLWKECLADTSLESLFDIIDAELERRGVPVKSKEPRSQDNNANKTSKGSGTGGPHGLPSALDLGLLADDPLDWVFVMQAGFLFRRVLRANYGLRLEAITTMVERQGQAGSSGGGGGGAAASSNGETSDAEKGPSRTTNSPTAGDELRDIRLSLVKSTAPVLPDNVTFLHNTLLDWYAALPSQYKAFPSLAAFASKPSVITTADGIFNSSCAGTQTLDMSMNPMNPKTSNSSDNNNESNASNSSRRTIKNVNTSFDLQSPVGVTLTTFFLAALAMLHLPRAEDPRTTYKTEGTPQASGVVSDGFAKDVVGITSSEVIVSVRRALNAFLMAVMPDGLFPEPQDLAEEMHLQQESGEPGCKGTLPVDPLTGAPRFRVAPPRNPVGVAMLLNPMQAASIFTISAAALAVCGFSQTGRKTQGAVEAERGCVSESLPVIEGIGWVWPIAKLYALRLRRLVAAVRQSWTTQQQRQS